MNDHRQSGDIFDYPYLWEWQHLRGETEGRKDRPCCLALVVPQPDGQTRLYLLPITTTPPDNGELAIQIPALEARRAGLDRDRRQWVILSEWNMDIAETSYYLDRHVTPRGRFSKPFLAQCFAILQKQLEAGRLTVIRRDD